jgi:VCBS repeat-containing protein
VIRFAGFDPRAQGMQAPVSEISLPWSGESLSFDELLARGLRIIGTPDNDVLTGTALADWIEGLDADDTMMGGAGGDIYVIADDGGTDTLIDSEDGDATNVLALPEGTTLDDVRLSYDSEGFLILDLDNTGNRIRLSGFDPENPLGSRAVERFRFGPDGDEVDYEELLERGFEIFGTEEDDALRGTAFTDRVWGDDGNDLIEATPGDDWLAGETGNDVYVVKLGDGMVTIDDVAEEDAGNVLRFGPGVDANALRNNLRFEEDGNGGHVLLIHYGGDGDVVLLTGFDPQDAFGFHAVDRFEFADGTAADYATLVSWTFVVEGDNAGNALDGTNVGDRLYGYDGDDVLDASGGEDVLTGGLGNDLLRGGVGRDAYVVNPGDGIDVIVDDVEDEVGNVLTFGEGISREDVRIEVDDDDLLIHYGADGDVVRVSGYAPAGADGGTVIDTLEFADGTAVTLREFMNRAPEVANPIDDQVVLEDAAFNLTLPDNLFIDADGDAILTRVTVSGYETPPDWLRYDAATRTLFGTPENGDVGEFDVVVQGTDALGASALHSFHVTVHNTNDAPEVGTSLFDLRALEDAAFSFMLPADSFRDVDVGDVLGYTATLDNGEALPDWLSFDAQTRTFSGTPVNGEVGSLRLRVTATDLAGETASQVFPLEVVNTNDAPTIGLVLTAHTVIEDAAFTYVLPEEAFVDADVGDRLTYTATLANGDALPAWLHLDGQTGAVSGTPGNDNVGELQVVVKATDRVGASASQTFVFVVANTNDAPQVSVTLTDQQATEDAPFVFTVPEDVFRDVDAGDVLTLSATQADGSALPAWLSFDAATRTFSGLPANGDVGSVSLRLTATDLAGAQAGQTFTVGVVNVNDAPEVGIALTNQTARTGNPVTWQLPPGAFIDVDAGDVFTYSASLADGSTLPDWLAFDAATGSFSGTPTTAGNYAVQITATDLAGAQASQRFALDVVSGGGNLAPVTAPDTANVIEDRKLLAWGNVLANDRDPEGGRLRVADAGIRRGEYGVLTLLSNGAYAYVLDDCSPKGQSLGTGETVVDHFSYLASDGTNRTSGELAVMVQGTNDAPELSRALADVQLAKGKVFSWKMPAGSFTDRDRTDTLSYTATLSNGKPLPTWLKFDAATQAFSGAAPANAKDAINVKIVAGDGHGASSTASDVFKISFGNKPILPTAPKGNEGVGNGSDAPSPGHTVNQNDGPGTGPGQPGNKPHGAQDDPLARFLDGFKTDGKESHPALPALDRKWFEQWDERQQPSEQSGQHRGNHDFQRHWSELAHALNRLDAERQGASAWCHPNQGADVSGLAGLMQGGSHATSGGVDTVSLACGGTQLKAFAGLREGMSKLTC